MMSDKELAVMLPFINTIAATTWCLMAMWVTGAKNPNAVHLIKAWKFRYITLGATWTKLSKTGKVKNFTGRYTAQNTELLLFAGRGHIPLPAVKLLSNTIISPRREHSRKPDEARVLLETMYPQASKIELFAREKKEGWDAWGNETNKFSI